ncbi:MAG: hypothetical protein EOM87_08615, partial [Clostridia bacterium]|nr:hypothetical protein [Clostridia bacterium]
MKKITTLLLSLILILGGLTMTSCGKNNGEMSEESDKNNSSQIASESSDETSTEVSEEGNLAYKCPYFYDCGIKIVGDDHMLVLTDGNNESYA